MRILIVSDTYYPMANGQAIFTVNLAEGLARRGHSVTVATQSEHGRPYQTERNGVKIFTTAGTSLNYWYPNLYISLLPGKEIRQIIDEVQPDIIHIQDHFPICAVAVDAAKERKIKVVGTNHFMPENLAPHLPFLARMQGAFNWVLWHWMRSVFDRLDAATAPSATAVAILRGQGVASQLSPISCGVDLQRFRVHPDVDRAAVRRQYGLDPARTLFLFVGRVDGEKKLDVLLHALSRLNRKDIQLGIAGKGTATEELKGLANQLNLGDKVVFVGYVPDADLPALLNSADVFAMPSEAELLSIASLEAMGCGKPMLAAQSRALPELVSNGQNGYLFQPGNPADAARVMTLLANRPRLLPQLGAASLEIVQEHSIENTLRKYEELYESALSGAMLLAPASGSLRVRIAGRNLLRLVAQLLR